MTRELQTMIDKVFPLVAAVVAAIHLPALKKRGVKVVDAGTDFGAVVTNVDLKASDALISGIPGGRFVGCSTLLPDSFSEEKDSPDRKKVLECYEVDPMDGSGDALTGLSPTVLVSHLQRASVDQPFEVVAGLVFDVLGGYAVVSDGEELLLGVPGAGYEFEPVRTRRLYPDHRDGALRIPHRQAYRQANAHELFPPFLATHIGRQIEQVPAGGADRQALQFLRHKLEPTRRSGCPAFYDLQPIGVLLNFQPDWKSWDTDPLTAAMQVLGLPTPTDIYGRPLTANAAHATLRDMWHRQGGLFVVDEGQRAPIVAAVELFEAEHGVGSLLTKNY